MEMRAEKYKVEFGAYVSVLQLNTQRPFHEKNGEFVGESNFLDT